MQFPFGEWTECRLNKSVLHRGAIELPIYAAFALLPRLCGLRRRFVVGEQ